MQLVNKTTKINAAGNPPKIIEEFIGMVNSNNNEISIAKMKSPKGWNEPGQTPNFSEYTIVLKGTLVVETKNGKFEIQENQAIIISKNEWIRYSTPYDNGAEYIAVCIPAFSPKLVNRDKEL
jgi:mannose-6-phosphate isomerase-like protein (cupin superfamily)